MKYYHYVQIAIEAEGDKNQTHIPQHLKSNPMSEGLLSARETFRTKLGLSSDPTEDPSRTGRVSGRSTGRISQRSELSVGMGSSRSMVPESSRSQLSYRSTARSGTSFNPQTSSRSATFDSARTWRTEVSRFWPCCLMPLFGDLTPLCRSRPRI